MTKILIAEDDKEINRLLSEFLKNQGYEVISVFNGLEANSIIYGL
ncbi:MAG: response regulator transcription factor [Lachnospiraceae bacterium]|nr:response regulator transcription factor [Lachnospiraceae bacterium]